MKRARTILCLASYEKGADFLRACKALGCRVLLLTQERLAGAAWPRDAIDHLGSLPDMYNRPAVVAHVSRLARAEQIDRIVALDDFDVEMAAALREHLRLPGIGDSQARLFRDKLAMRVKAGEAGLHQPAFVHLLNDRRLGDYLERVPPPWVLKPRSQASAVGIKVFTDPDPLWAAAEALGDERANHLLEHYVPGVVCHVDALVVDGEVLFTETHHYGTPPLDVSHGGGVFSSRTIPRGSDDDRALRALNRDLIRVLGLGRGVTHTEFIKGHDGQFYFLETAARVAGAHLAELIEAATGVNLWREWARIEVGGEPYALPPVRDDYAGSAICLARQEHPDTGAYRDPEIVWRLDRPHHAGLIVAAPDPARVERLLDDYLGRFAHDFLAFHPAPDKPTS